MRAVMMKATTQAEAATVQADRRNIRSTVK